MTKLMKKNEKTLQIMQKKLRRNYKNGGFSWRFMLQ
jgi:hypothetical protein